MAGTSEKDIVFSRFPIPDHIQEVLELSGIHAVSPRGANSPKLRRR